MTKPTCPHCRVTMEAGHLLDRSKAEIQPLLWVAGPADWRGMVWWSLRSKLKNHEVHGVVSYRCPECGYLSSFARASTLE